MAEEFKFNGEIWMRIPVTQKQKGEPDEFVIARNKKSAGGLIPYARWGNDWSATPIPLRTLIRELVLLVERYNPNFPETIFCKNCQEVTEIDILFAFCCAECEDRICTKCGCTESAACANGCDWAAPGICTECTGND